MVDLVPPRPSVAASSTTPFPFDILYHTIPLIEFPTLKIFSAVNREIRHACIRRLWRSLCVGAPVVLEEELEPENRRNECDAALACLYQALRRDPRRGGYIRHLTLRLSGLVGSTPIISSPITRLGNGSEEEKALRDVFGEVLQSVKNVVFLSILTDHSQRPFDTRSITSICLSKADFPFTLSSFETNVHPGHIVPFLVSQPGIRTYKSDPGYHTRSCDIIPETCLPLLESFAGDMEDAIQFIPGRPIHDVDILYDFDLEDLLNTFPQSTTPVTHLHIPEFADCNPAHVLDVLSNHMSDLTHLEVHLDSRHLEPTAPEWQEDLSNLISAFDYFPHLEVLKIEDSSKTGWYDMWQLELLVECYPLPALKRIELNVHGTPEEEERSVVYSRGRVIDAWSVESGDTKVLEYLVQHGDYDPSLDEVKARVIFLDRS